MTSSSQNTPGDAMHSFNEHSLLLAVSKAQDAYITDRDKNTLFQHLLDSLLEVAASEYGFIGEVFESPDGKPYLKAHAITDISWNEETRLFYERNAPAGLEFTNLQSLFGAVLTSGAAVISNTPLSDPRRGGLPEGHPPLRAFLGVPLHKHGQLIGMIGIANRPGGYDEQVIHFLHPLLSTCATVIDSHRAERARRQTESALLESERRIQAIVDSAVDAILTIDENGTIISANAATERMFSYTAAELQGNNVSLLMPSPDKEQHDSYISNYMSSGKRKVIGIGREVVGRRRDGARIPLHLTVSEVELSEKKLFTGILRDISDLKSAHAELEELLRLSRKSREDMRAILNELQIGSVILDGDANVKFMSDSCLRLIGKELGHVVGSHWTRVCPFGADDKQKLAELLAVPAEMRTRLPIYVEAPSGQRFWMDLDVQQDPRDEQGKILFMYDMTEVHALRSQIEEHATFQDLIGKSESMRRVFEEIVELARVDVTVLIEGETGTGKELVARAIHAESSRKDRPFVAVNCAGLSDALLGSQLFGHRRGAFTGAINDQAGLFETAEGGTIFLDEIGDISPQVQRALLRVLQEKEILRLGESQARSVDVRVLTATHRDLKKEVDEGRFRQDLLYRVRIAPVRLPALRERPLDIPLLADAFLRRACVSVDKQIERISQDALNLLMDYRWPGNVRELQNAIEFAAVRCKGKAIETRDLPIELTVNSQPGKSPEAPQSEYERIVEALRLTEGNRAAAARMLGISRATIYRKLSELQIRPDAVQDATPEFQD